MAPLKPKTRREFMVAATRWGLDLAFLSVIPFASCSHAETPQENSVATDNNMTLKQIAQNTNIETLEV